jgi:hypothetical protein
MKDRIRICIKEGKDSYKVTSIYLKSDGSFKLDFPYCEHKEGLLTKLSLPPNVYCKKESYVSYEERETFLVKNRPQLSVHTSGFVQISGPGIKSGIDQNTQIRTGPTCSVLFWGLKNGYEKVVKPQTINYFIPDSAFTARVFNMSQRN